MPADDGPILQPRVACDAMCGGLARWLRLLGVDAAFEPDIDDRALVQLALREGRCIVSSDRRLFDRRPLRDGRLRGICLPNGLRLHEQVRFVLRALAIRPGPPRCACCNGPLQAVSRAEVAGEVPARTLIWVREYARCGNCGHVFWEGTHWQRIRQVLASVQVAQDPAGRYPPH